MTAPSSPSRFQLVLENFALLLNLAMRTAGLVLGTYLILFQDKHDPIALAYSGLLVAGGQISETLILGVVDRLMGDRREAVEAGGHAGDRS